MPACRIFCSYAREDERLRRRLEEQLAPLRRDGLIADWYDHQILPGQAYDTEIAAALDAADVVLLLVSASFFASDYCYERELQRALARRRQGEVEVVPVILRDCDWQRSVFGMLAALPDGGRPVAGGWRNQAEALANVARGLRRLVEALSRRAPPDAADREQVARVRGQFDDIRDGVRRLRRERNSAWQFCESLDDYVEWLDQALDDLSPAGLTRIHEAHVQLIHLADEADRDWPGHFEQVPLGAIMSRLDQLTPGRETAPGADPCWVANDRDDPDRPHRAIVDELIAEIGRVERQLDDLKEILSPQDRQGLRADLTALRFLLRRDPLKLDDVSTVKARLARIETDMLRRTIVLTQVLLGCHAAHLPAGAVFQDREDTPEMVVIPAGSFLMGSPSEEEGRRDAEGPQHEVRIAHRFAVGRHPVSFEEYDGFAQATGREPPHDQGWGRDRRPVINVSWDDAKAFVAWLSQEIGRPYRLLSEAEWEYACRAGTTTRYSWGNEITPEDASYDRGETTEVGTYPPNPWGLYDMHGNVWEWSEDCWNENYEGASSDGRAWTSGDCDRRVVRGGSWINSPVSLRSAYRNSWDTVIRFNLRGFRVARTLR